MSSTISSKQEVATRHAPPARRTQQRREATRNKLLAATIEVLLKKGYSGLRVADAAAAAGVSRGAQTHHFPTKEALIEAVIAKVFESELGASEAAAAITEDSEILKGAATHATTFLDSDQYHITSNLIISAKDSPELVESIRAISATSRNDIERAWTNRLEQIGIGSDDAKNLLWVLFDALRAVAVRKRHCGDGSQDARLVSFTIDLLNDHLDRLKNGLPGTESRERGKGTQRQEERRELTRKKLLDAAVKIILERGCAGLRSADVSDVAGVSRGGQLHHFPSKDMLVSAVLERILAEASDKTERRIAEACPDGRTLLKMIVQDAENFFFTDQYRVAIDIMMSSDNDSDTVPALRVILKRLLEPADNAWIRCLAGTGIDIEPARDIVWFLWSVVHGLAIRGLARRNEQHEATVTSLALQLANQRLDALRMDSAAQGG